MGFSTNGAAAILFLAAFMVVGAVVPAAQASFEGVSESMASRENRMLATTNTDVNLTNATYNATTDELTVTVENTGTTSLLVNDTDVIVDGEIRSNATMAVEGSARRTVWAPGQRLTITVSMPNQPQRVVVVTEHAVSEGTDDITVVQ